MAITFDAGSLGYTNFTTSVTATHVIGSGSNRILFALVLSTEGDYLTGVTYNGVSLSSAAKSNYGSTGYLYIYYLVAPDVGSHSLVASFSANTFGQVDGLSFFGASQTGIPDATGSTSGNSAGTTITQSVTTVADNCWAVLVARNGAGPYSAQTNSTINPADNGLIFSCGFYSTNAKTPAGTMSMAWSWSSAGASDYGDLMVSFAPYTAPTANKNFLMFMPN